MKILLDIFHLRLFACLRYQHFIENYYFTDTHGVADVIDAPGPTLTGILDPEEGHLQRPDDLSNGSDASNEATEISARQEKDSPDSVPSALESERAAHILCLTA